MILAFFDFGFSEMLLVGVVALLMFGGNLPDVMRTLGRNYAKLRASLREFSAPVRDEINRVTKLPPPEGIVSQMINTEDDDPDYDMSDVPPITTTVDAPDARSPNVHPPGERAPERKAAPASSDLLDEGPLV